jgi:hypothetical protein
MGRLKTAAKSGDRLKALIELRDLLAERLESAEADRDVAALSRQFVQVTAEIDEIRSRTETKPTSLSQMRSKLKVVGDEG